MIYEIHENTDEVEGLVDDGRPDPAYAAALGLLQAPFGRRAGAAVTDALIWMILQVPLWVGAIPLLLKVATGSISTYGLVNHPSFVFAVVMTAITVVLSLVFAIVQWVLHGRRGVTIGKAAFGLRSVNVRTLARPKVFRVLLRLLVVGVAGIVPVLGPAAVLASPMVDPDRRGRGWHDKASGVWLVDVRNGLNPYDEKRMRVARKMVKADPTPERAPLPSLATPDDPSAKPVYRPGSRVSAGVLGVARPYEANERPVVGLARSVEPSASSTGGAGKPVLGGYRPGAATPSLTSTPPAPVAPVVPTPPRVASSPAGSAIRPADPASAPAAEQSPAPTSRRGRAAAARGLDAALDATALAPSPRADAVPGYPATPTRSAAPAGRQSAVPVASTPGAADRPLPPGIRQTELPPGDRPLAVPDNAERVGRPGDASQSAHARQPQQADPPRTALPNEGDPALRSGEPSLRRPRRSAQAAERSQPADATPAGAPPSPSPAAQAAPTAPAAPSAAAVTPGPRRHGAVQDTPPTTSRVQYGLRFDSGEVVAVAAPLLLGRRPDAGAHPGSHVHPLADDSRSLSKTHLLVRPVAGGLEVTDCGSSNGSSVRRGEVQRELTPGEPLVVAAGDVVRLGERTAVVISR